MTLAADGTPAALRDRWLGPACRGQVRGGIALGGLLPGPPRLRARPDRGGWRLDGGAPWVTGWGLIDLLLVAARGPDDSLVSLIVDAAAQPGLTVTRERLAAVHASVTVRLGFDGVLVPGERWAGQEPFDPAESRRPDRMRVNGSLAPGRWVPGRSTTSWHGAGTCSTPRSPSTPRRWRRHARQPRSWPCGRRPPWRWGTAAARSPWTSTRSGSPARRCSCWCSGHAP